MEKMSLSNMFKYKKREGEREDKGREKWGERERERGHRKREGDR